MHITTFTLGESLAQRGKFFLIPHVMSLSTDWYFCVSVTSAKCFLNVHKYKLICIDKHLK